MTTVVNVNDLLDGHVVLDLDCLDRIYLNAYVPSLQTPGRWWPAFGTTSRCPSPHRR